MALMSEPVTSRQDDTRKQLGAFLRARRESLDPQRLGLPRSGRRRTPGLRREEVAMLADVGVTWYTWLEQGRDVNPSSAVMAAVAKALQCTPTEARHLFVLAGLPPGEAPQAVCCEGISEGTRRLLDTLMPKPASIQKPNFDIVAWNDSFGHLMGVDFNAIPPEDRNCIYLFLTHAAWRTSSSCLPIPSWGILRCSRCTGTPRRETARGCWCTSRWMTRGSGQWHGWRRRGNRFSARGFQVISTDPVMPVKSR